MSLKKCPGLGSGHFEIVRINGILVGWVIKGGYREFRTDFIQNSSFKILTT